MGARSALAVSTSMRSPVLSSVRCVSGASTIRAHVGRIRILASTSCRCRNRRSTVAMVNVDLGPATILGTTMVVSGLALYQIRASRPWLSRDYDVVVSSIAVLTGGILVFQGWRLDPLLLFGQLLTAATATAFAAEVLSLRNKLIERESPDEVDRRLGPGTPEDFRRESWDDTSNGRLSPSERGAPLPPPQQRSYGDFAGPNAWEEDEEYYQAADARNVETSRWGGARYARESGSPSARGLPPPEMGRRMRFDDYRNDAYDELDDYEYDRRGDMGARSDFPAPALETYRERGAVGRRSGGDQRVKPRARASERMYEEVADWE